MGKNVELSKAVVVEVQKNVNGTNEGKMVFLGKEEVFGTNGELTIGGNVVKLQFKELTGKLLAGYPKKWDVEVSGFTFQTYKDIEGNNFTDLLKDGKLYISNLGYQSIKRIAESKNWKESKLHNEYLKAVGRISTKNATTHKGEL